MIIIHKRPAGIWLLGAMLLVDGIGSLVEAVSVTWIVEGDVWRTIAQVVVGLALLYKAHGILTLKLGAWMVLLAIVCLKAILSVVTILSEPSEVVGYADLVADAIVALYLLHPRIRSYFSKNGTDFRTMPEP